MSDPFPLSRWSLILAGRDIHGNLSQACLEQLCAVYWQPVHDFISRRRQVDTQEVEDLTQAYFVSLLARERLNEADPSRGKLRAFLVRDIQFFLANEGRKRRAESRGGGVQPLSLDAVSTLGGYKFEPMSSEPQPDLELDRKFAAALLRQALTRLAAETRLAPSTFQQIRRFLFWGDGDTSYREVAQKLQSTESNVKTMVKRQREDFRRILREEVHHVVEDPADIDTELRYLSQLMS